MTGRDFEWTVSFPHRIFRVTRRADEQVYAMAVVVNCDGDNKACRDDKPEFYRQRSNSISKVELRDSLRRLQKLQDRCQREPH